MKKEIRCAIYTRKSSEEGLEQGFNSLDAQREACEAYIKSQVHEGWVLIEKQYNDGGFSGGTMNRPAFKELMEDIKQDKIDIIVVYKVDRLTRSIMDFAKIIEVFDSHETSFVSITQHFNTTTSMGRLTLNILLSFAQFEREVTGEEARAIRIADHRIAEDAEWDFEILKTELEEILNFDFSIEDLGFSSVEYDKIISFSTDDKQDKKAKAKAKAEENAAWLKENIPHRVKLGNLFRLGDHFVLCGDSLNPENYKILLHGGEKANVIVTDPPYNCKIENFVSKTSQHQDFEMAAGEMSDAEFTDFINKFMQNLVNYSEQGSLHYLFMDWRNIHLLVQEGKKLYSKHKNILVWNKGVGGMGNLYRSQHELIALFQNGTTPPDMQSRESSDRHRTNVLDYAGIRATTSGAKDLLKLHPTVKPVALLYDLLLDSSLKNDIVLDCFGGSGSTLLAAERAKRRARIIELNPRYVDVILWRWERETGKEAKLVNEK